MAVEEGDEEEAKSVRTTSTLRRQVDALEEKNRLKALELEHQA